MFYLRSKYFPSLPLLNRSVYLSWNIIAFLVVVLAFSLFQLYFQIRFR